MKNYFYSALAMIVLAGCAGSEIDEVVDNGQPVAIALKAGVQTTSVVSRAPITGSATFKPTIMGWNVATEPGAVAPDWATTTNEEIAGDATNVGITLLAPQYYQADGSKTYMKAFYAEGATINANAWKYDFTNTDGQKDVLMAAAISGDKNTAASGFAFTHPLMQLKFKLVAGDGFPDDVKVTSMTIKGAQLPIGVDMSDNTVTYAAAAALAVPGAADSPISTQPTAGNPVMGKPFTGKTFTMEIVTSEKTYPNVTVTLDDAIGAGVAYTVTLTFKEKISATASVSEWTDGTGSGTVE